MQRMPVIVSPELRNAEARWLDKSSPRYFSFLTALKVKTALLSYLELQTVAGQNARVKIVQPNKKCPFAVLSQSPRRGRKESPSVW